MNDKSFLDTNILVYCYTENEPDKKAVALALAQHSETWISTQVLQELSNTLRKKFRLSWPDINATLHEVSQNLGVYTNQYDTITNAVRIAERYGYSFYDCLIISSCLAIGCDVLYSEDLQNRQVIDGILEIRNPFS
ncbi:PIN domain-containing protein [Haliscomenobacter hydrossis]|uniref:PilT protein domain protein n=1 Tax=Haliscomenobacter hydrossis (strain ATCC 27775 / DSM 1100 / LMG 10767 / O) TaxID=760192 RepID=F4KVV9_HALH1|nr:PIN domain-containing protein [Haliscomenobacter hydrossis]AEE53534.1 PilT protein domain protein [Haliscomenobacter hydrossis DSM 1100]